MKSANKYNLTITSYPDSEAIHQVCKAIYGIDEPKLLASLSAIPYAVGRSFEQNECHSLAQDLKALKVGFKFNSQLEVIEFDPNDIPIEKQEEEDDPRVSPPRLTPAAIKTILIITLGIVLLLGTVFYLSKESSNTQIDSKPYNARLTRFINRVEFRNRDDLLWSPAKQKLGLSFEDALRTFGRSNATLVYKEGSKVYVKENTLIVIGQTKATEEEVERNIELESGSLRASLQPEQKKTHWKIATAQGTIIVSNESQSTKMNASIDKDKLNIVVEKGTASFKPTKKDAPIIPINRQQKLVATLNQLPVVETAPLIVALIEPVNGARFSLDPNESSFKFRWEELEPNVTYIFKLASDSRMENILLQRSLKSTTLDLTYLDPGDVYWQVETKIDDLLYKSPVRKIYVQKYDN